MYLQSSHKVFVEALQRHHLLSSVLLKHRRGKKVSGNNVGQIEKVTGNENGADRSLTGTQYMQRGEDTAPAKVAVSKTLRGGSVTGQHIGRSESVTGDEPGSCRNVTGDDYVGSQTQGTDV